MRDMIISRFPQALGRLAAAFVLALGLLFAAGAAQAMDGGFHGGGFHGGGFHGGGFHGGGFNGCCFHDGHFHHHGSHNNFFFGFGFGGWGWGPWWDPWWGWGPSWGGAGYYPNYGYPYPYSYYPPPAGYDPPPAGGSQYQPNCHGGQWRQQDGSIVSGTACQQPDGTWRMAY